MYSKGHFGVPFVCFTGSIFIKNIMLEKNRSIMYN